jgi:hypothetical protein
MKDPKGFVKLFDLNVPVLEHFDYYITQLSKTQKYRSIFQFLEMYQQCESEIGDAWSYRKSKSEEIIDFIQSTNAYSELCFDRNLVDYPVRKSIEWVEGVKYLSIDLRSANWTALKTYDPEHINELGNSYQEFLSKFDLPSVFIESKYLRQFIFGHINPKRLGKVQRNLIQDVVDKYEKILKVVGVRNDEVIFEFSHFEEIQKIWQEIDHVKYKVKIFTVDKVEDFRIDNLYNIWGELLHREMIGCDGTKFYIKLKQYITGEKLDVRDLYFKSAGNIAIWMQDNLKIELC